MNLSTPKATPRSFYNVPWGGRDILIGLVPVLAGFSISTLLRPVFATAPKWVWIPATALLMAWMIGYPLWLARRRVGMLRLPRPKSLLIEGLVALIAVPVVFLIVAAVAFSLIRTFGDIAMPSTPLGPIAGSNDRFQPLALIVLAVAVAPIAEEFFFRGMLFNALRRWLHPGLAACVQALIFGLLHPFNLSGRAMIAVIGLCFAGIYEWRKKLSTPILLHALMNAVSITLLMSEVASTPVLGVQVTRHEQGCRITELVPGGSAESEGFLTGDVITSVDGERVGDQPSLVRVLRTKRIGDKVQIDFIRYGAANRVEITLKGRPR